MLNNKIYLVLLLPLSNVAQTVNTGQLFVRENTVISTLYDFKNTEEGHIISDGETYYYQNFHNDGIYGISPALHSGKAVFTKYEDQKGMQVISGSKPSDFYHVVLDHAEPVVAFDLKNEANVYGSVDFKDGIIKVDSLVGMLTFHQGAKALHPTDKSHAEGYVEKIGNEEFQYPKGDKGLYRYARITAPENVKDAYQGKYNLDDKDFFRARSAKSGVINLLDEREYWTVDKGRDNSKGDIMLTLSWDERTTPKELLVNPEKELHIVRWDAKQQLWVDEGGVVDLEKKEITTPTSVKGYGFFTLATVNTDLILDGDIVIYNLVSPDGDDKNDYFIIDNINRFPNNTVEIYNRWGVKVYDTKSYDSAGNVFRGYSDGRVTINKGEKLPTGTYFYIVSYEYKDASGSRMIKKSGYLHLESNK
ncbi:gliding motility-associated C-terminal domain-containing protein [Myroides odoratimimus]|uniref:gliding motility-associated C-terminal domain-containing protein n=1 Tax=Myroides odoratimimus TaxID=76832 RepID=UPI002574AB75|nr:gliding motility-associated C-terminal domain-containing protein [Myroides odoratimimus]MDM1497056.1 gliding motility-associated C-terminal domain-containing protein [Myroides odoratimimus]